MLTEFNIARTRLESLDDYCGRSGRRVGLDLILAVVTAIVRSKFSSWMTMTMIAEALGYAVFMILVALGCCPVDGKDVTHRRREAFTLRPGVLADSHLSLGGDHEFDRPVFNFRGVRSYGRGSVRSARVPRSRKPPVEGLRLTVFFLPIFFTYTGLRTDIGTMHGSLMWAMCGLLVLTAIVGKIAGWHHGGVAQRPRLEGGLVRGGAHEYSRPYGADCNQPGP